MPPLVPLLPGTRVLRGVVFEAPGPGLFPQDYGVPIRITNVALPWSDAQTLLLSNSPETVSRGRILYRAIVDDGQTVRLVFHHKNGSRRRPMTFTVAVANPTESDLTLWVSSGIGGPVPDELGAGHQAARDFLEQYWDRAGFLLHRPARAAQALVVERVPPLAVVSGVLQLALVEGARLDLTVAARFGGEREAAAPPPAVQGDEEGSPAPPQVAGVASYVAGGPAALLTVRVSREAAPRGTYGVVSTFAVRLSNPLPVPVEARLTMHANGGPARGTFRIGDRVVDTPLVVPHMPRTLATLRLAPGAVRTLVVFSMAESGSSYPVLLVLGPP